VSFYSAAGHVKLFGDFVIVAALQKQVGDLLLARAQLYCFFGHDFSPERFCSREKAQPLLH